MQFLIALVLLISYSTPQRTMFSELSRGRLPLTKHTNSSKDYPMHTFSLQPQNNNSDNTALVITNVNSHQVMQLSFTHEELTNLRTVIDAYLTQNTANYSYTFNTDNIIDQIHEEFQEVKLDTTAVTDQYYTALHDFVSLDDAEQHNIVNTIINNKPLSVEDKTEEYENTLINHVITSLIDKHE